MANPKLQTPNDRRSPARSTDCPSRRQEPRISIVTPSFNQGQFLEETIQSVLSQDYPNLDYVVMDGGSTDGSAEIIREHASRLTYWQSRPDAGHYHALNEGFAHTDGEIMAWINSDDKYCPWTFSVVAEIFTHFPEIEWMTTLYPLTWDERGRAVACGRRAGYGRRAFFRGQYVPVKSRCPEGTIQQESTFWRRSLWEKAGAYLDTSLRLAADFELWTRFFQHTELVGVDVPLGGFRQHSGQKTARQLTAYADEALQTLHRYRGAIEGPAASFARRTLRQFYWPTALKVVASRLGWCERRKICFYREGAWHLQAV